MMSHAAAATHSCLVTAAFVEQREKLPRGLLYAIALTESGRWNAQTGESHAWPWTIRAKDDAFVAQSKSDAIQIVRDLRAEGRENIDVGCMQVNLKYHPTAFANLQDAFEPISNVTYAARFLKSLREQSRSWQQAIEWYHSRDRERGLSYRKRVYGHWRKAQIDINMAHQALSRAGRNLKALPASLVVRRVNDSQVPLLVEKNGVIRPSFSAGIGNGAGNIRVDRGGRRFPGSVADKTPQVRPSLSSGIAINGPGREAFVGIDVVRPRR